MGSFDSFRKRRVDNAKALSAFGVQPDDRGRAHYRTIREGNGTTVYTIGYERRDADELMQLLKDVAITTLVDIREKPISRIADFREEALRFRCADTGIQYVACAELGSPADHREELKRSGDFQAFGAKFRSHVRRSGRDAVRRVAALASTRLIALLCYERLHEECHRSIVADLVAREINATIVAIL